MDKSPVSGKFHDFLKRMREWASKQPYIMPDSKYPSERKEIFEEKEKVSTEPAALIDGMLTVINNTLCTRQNGKWVELKELTPEHTDILIKGMQGR